MAKPASTYQELHIQSDLSELADVRTFVVSQAEEFGFSEDVVFQISLAVDEACSNLIRHAYKLDASNRITVRIATKESQFIVSIFDAAISFDPTQLKSPDMNDYFSKFRHGGLGVHIIKRVMDDIKYIPANTKHPLNELRLTKRLVA